MSYFLAQNMVGPVRIGRQSAPAQVKPACSIDQRILYIHRGNIRQDHIMASQGNYPVHPAFQRQRAFGNERAADLGRILPG